MALKPVSLRVGLVTALLVIGVFALAVVYLGTGKYRAQLRVERETALDTTLALVPDLLKREAGADALLLAGALRGQAGWDHAWRLRDPAALAERLSALGPTPAARPRVLRLQLLDADANSRALVAPAVRAATVAPTGCHFPPARDAAAPISAVCLIDRYPVLATRVPIASGPNAAHLEVVYDLPAMLRALEPRLGLSLMLALGSGEALDRSPRWAELATTQTPRTTQPLATVGGAPLVLRGVRHTAADEAQFERDRVTAVLVAAIGLLVLSYLSLLLLDRGVSSALQGITARLRAIAAGQRVDPAPLPTPAPLELHELNAEVSAVSRHLQQVEQNLVHAAFTDALTGLPNRALFQDRLQQLIVTAARDPKPFALMLIDLDRFKEINDTLGHPMGDALLRQVAERLRGKLRESDTVARLGGDEFAILLPGVGERHAATAARMLLQSLRVPLMVESHQLDVAGSIGIAVYPEHGVDGDTLMQRADVAMYAAKDTGHGIVAYHPGLDQHHGERLALMADLRRAIELEQFELHYQPKVDLATGHVMGLEALVRWRHPRNGLVSPDTFIPLLERTGQIRSLTPWIMGEAMAFCRRLQQSDLSLTVAMNLSVRDLQDPAFPEMALEQLAAHGLDPSVIELEVTESALMTEPESALGVLANLAEAGFRIAIDDFGTGYSSFAYLKKMPVHTLKIDKSFVQAMGSDASDAAIVRTSIDLAHNLNLRIVAEGIETQETLEQLRTLGCDAAQGHFISRALPADDLVTWLRDSYWGVTPELPRAGAL